MYGVHYVVEMVSVDTHVLCNGLWISYKMYNYSTMEDNLNDYQLLLEGPSSLNLSLLALKQCTTFDTRTVPSTLIFKKKKTCSILLSSFRNTSGSLAEGEMLKERKPTGECFHNFLEFSQIKLPQVSLTWKKHREHVLYFF